MISPADAMTWALSDEGSKCLDMLLHELGPDEAAAEMSLLGPMAAEAAALGVAVPARMWAATGVAVRQTTDK